MVEALKIKCPKFRLNGHVSVHYRRRGASRRTDSWWGTWHPIQKCRSGSSLKNRSKQCAYLQVWRSVCGHGSNRDMAITIQVWLRALLRCWRSGPGLHVCYELVTIWRYTTSRGGLSEGAWAILRSCDASSLYLGNCQITPIHGNGHNFQTVSPIEPNQSSNWS